MDNEDSDSSNDNYIATLAKPRVDEVSDIIAKMATQMKRLYGAEEEETKDETEQRWKQSYQRIFYPS